MLWFLVFAIVTLISYLVYTRIWKQHKYWEERDVIHTKSWPILGDFTSVIFRKKTFFQLILDIYKQCPGERYFGVNQFLTPTLVVRDLELMKKITVKDFDHFEDHKVVTPPDVDPMFGKSLFSLNGQQWRQMRAILSPAFTSAKMKNMFQFMSECSEKFAQHYLNTGKDITTVELKDVFTRYTSDVIASTAFGLKCDSQENENNEFYVTGREATYFGFIRSFLFFAFSLCPTIIKTFKIPLFPKRIADFYRRIVKETIQAREKQRIIRPDMIHLLMEARKGKLKHEEISKENSDVEFSVVQESSIGKQDVTLELTDDDVTAQAVIFVFGGLDTSATLMSFMGYELAINPDVQKKLQNEIDETYKNCNEKLTYDALTKMKYLDMVTTETLRKWPPGFVIDRICVKPYTIQPELPGEKPLSIEPNTVIWYPVGGVHHDPKYYPEPEKFDPERFNDENKAIIVSGTYMPFGEGPRNCIGSRFALLENKILFFHLLLKFDIVPIEKTQIPLKVSKTQFTLNSENGFWLGFKKRI